jgi:phosphate transport system substrate-binding protein
VQLKPRDIILCCLLLSFACTTTGCRPSAGGTGTGIIEEGSVRGAGATFPAPLYKKWLEQYRHQHPDVKISYEAVGSGEGTERFLAQAVDFGASDAALSDEQIAKVDRGVRLIPTTAGSIVLAYNLRGVSDLELSRDVYVDIFAGEITKWNDPRITKINPDVALPNRTIAVVARQDSSGTTFAFTNHLSAISEDWRDRGPGTGKLIDWPGAVMLAPGNEGVAGLIKRTPDSIGYVEYGMASRTGLTMAALENKAGNYVEPTGTSGMATLTNAELPDNLRAFFPDPDGSDSYPIVTFTWILLYAKYDDPEVSRPLKAFMRWCLVEGQEFSEELGYIRLAPTVADAALTAVESVGG